MVSARQHPLTRPPAGWDGVEARRARYRELHRPAGACVDEGWVGRAASAGPFVAQQRAGVVAARQHLAAHLATYKGGLLRARQMLGGLAAVANEVDALSTEHAWAVVAWKLAAVQSTGEQLAADVVARRLGVGLATQVGVGGGAARTGHRPYQQLAARAWTWVTLHRALVGAEGTVASAHLPTGVRGEQRVILWLLHFSTEAAVHQWLRLVVAAMRTGEDLALAVHLAPGADALEVIDLKALRARPNRLL
jgi:hypothetical protein